MHNKDGFGLLILFVFYMIPQLGGLGTKSQDLVISFRLGERETIPQFHLRYFKVRRESFLLQYETGNINNLTGKYIMEISKLKHFQCYVAIFGLEYRLF